MLAPGGRDDRGTGPGHRGRAGLACVPAGHARAPAKRPVRTRHPGRGPETSTRPDLLCLEADQILVIDFKTGAPAPEHATQVRRYLRLAAALPGRTPCAGPAHRPLVYLDRRETVNRLPE
jgi:hypothetical protein